MPVVINNKQEYFKVCHYSYEHGLKFEYCSIIKTFYFELYKEKEQVLKYLNRT